MNLFERMVGEQYAKHDEWPWPVEDYIQVFRLFTEAYKYNMGHDHPAIRMKHIPQLMYLMPILDPDDPSPILEADDYPVLIESYFETPFQNCNYQIWHFFSGQVRLMRAYEVLL